MNVSTDSLVIVEEMPNSGFLACYILLLLAQCALCSINAARYNAKKQKIFLVRCHLTHVHFDGILILRTELINASLTIIQLTFTVTCFMWKCDELVYFFSFFTCMAYFLIVTLIITGHISRRCSYIHCATWRCSWRGP